MHLFGVSCYMHYTSCAVIVGNLCARHDDLREILSSLLFWNNSFPWEVHCASHRWLSLLVIYWWNLYSCLYSYRLLFTVCLFDSALVFYSQLNFFKLSYPWWFIQSGATSFRYHLGARRCKGEHLQTEYSLHHWCREGGNPIWPYLAFCNLFIYVFIWSDGGCS